MSLQLHKLPSSLDYLKTFQSFEIEVKKNNLVLKARKNNLTQPRLGYNIPKRGTRLANRRNRLKRIIKEEKARLLREQEEGGSANGDHHWPRVDWSNVGDLVDKWTSLEYDAWDKGDTSMNPDDVTDVEARQHWGDQVESAGLDMESELTVRIRRVALQTMKEFSDKLVNGEYS